MILTLTDPQGRILYVNQTHLNQLMGQMVGKNILDYIPPIQHDTMRGYLRQVVEYGHTIISEEVAYNPLQTPGWFETRLSPMREGEHIRGVVIFSVDITERSHFERELSKRAVQLETVAEVSTQLKSMLELNQLVQSICDLTRQSFKLYHVHIYLMDEDGKRLVVQAGSGELGQQIVATRRSFALEEQQIGLVAEAARLRRVVWSNQVKEDPRFLPNPLLPATQSEMAIPIMTSDYLLGVLDVHSDQANFFTGEDVRVQQILADQIAIAIQNAQLYENILQQWEIASTFRDISLAMTSNHGLQATLILILKEVTRILPYEAAVIWLQEGEDERNLRVLACVGYQERGINREALEDTSHKFNLLTFQKIRSNPQVIFVPDTYTDPAWIPIPMFSWVHSWAGAPIIIRGKLAGLLTFDHAEPQFYGHNHEGTLEMLSRQISLVVENAQLLEAERTQREVAETLRDIGTVLASQLEKGDILQLVLGQVARVLPYKAAAIWLDNGRGEFRAAAHAGYEQFGALELVEKRVMRISDPGFYVYKTTEIISDTAQDPRWLIEPGFEWIKSWAATAIMVRDQFIGTLALDHTQAAFYTDQHRRLLESLANQISLAVGNARLLEAERRRRQEIEIFQRNTASLTSFLELPSVLDAILQAISKLVSLSSAYIFLYDGGLLTYGAGIDERGQAIAKPDLLPHPKGLTAQVARTGDSVLVEDIAHYPLFQEIPHPLFMNYNSLISLALKFRERVVGVMHLCFKHLEQLLEVELDLLELLANQASIAIENARLFKATQDYATLLESRVLERTAELDAERAQLKAILDGMGEGVIYHDGQQVQYVNDRLALITGYHFETLPSYPKLLAQIAAPNSNTASLIQRSMERIQKQGQWQGEIKLQRGDNGQEFTASLFTTAAYSPTGDPSGYVSIIRDISQEKALQEQKDRFISNASHELKTPLTNIQTRLYLLKKRPDKAAEHLEVIEAVTAQMAGLIRDLLDLARFERGLIRLKRENLVLQGLVQQVVDIQQGEAEIKKLHLRASYPPQTLIIQADAARLTQVLTNLVINAINYTEPGGQVEVAVLAPSGFSVQIQVRDNGIGIPDELLPQLFQPFFRASDGSGTGTGLGLSISKEIVEAHGGHLEVISQVGQGSTFTLSLPLSTSGPEGL
jgi:PAS domain S-box-containing protein